MIQHNRPLATLLLILPLALLTRCTTDDNSSTGPAQMPDPVPVIECNTVDQCELPRSTCSDSVLVYYTAARCDAGYCAWDQQTTTCAGGCYNGGCAVATSTAAGGPPFDPCSGQSGSIPPECIGGAGGSGDDDSAVCDADDDGGPGQCVP